MNLKISNVGKIKYADLDLNGVTVIAGNNSTGKSTVSKSLYTMIKCFYNFTQSVDKERKAQCAKVLKKWAEAMQTSLEKYRTKQRRKKNVLETQRTESQIKQFEMFRNRLNRESFQYLGIMQECSFDDIYQSLDTFENFWQHMDLALKLDDMLEHLDEKDADSSLKNLKDELKKNFKKMVSYKTDPDIINSKVRREVARYMTYPLSSQFNTDKESRIEFQIKSGDLAYIASNESKDLFQYEPLELTSEMVYIQPKHVLDEMGEFFFLEGDPNEDILINQIKRKTVYETEEGVSVEEAELIKNVLETIETIIKEHESNSIYGEPIGEISRGENLFHSSYAYQDETLDSSIPFTVVASGIKNMVIVKRLIANGTLKKGSFFVMDEPEVNLHPEWQLIFAEILVMLRKELGVWVLINTHSPYFMRAIECYCDKYDIMEELDIYTTEKEKASERQYTITNVSMYENGIAELYYNMSRPLALLQEMLDNL